MSQAEQYRVAGVDLEAAESAKTRIARSVASTRTSLTRGAVGAFGGMVRVPDGVDDPVLVCSTDGVGSKLLVAVQADRHDTVGEDLVNHSVNDILVHGARPLAFLDYLAVSGVSTHVIAAIVEGVARACREHEMALIGGETAQLPDLYQQGHYDLAGTIIGVVDEAHALHGDAVQPGNRLVGYASSGLHTNGYTLARRILFETLDLQVDSPMPEHDGLVGDVLLEVHRSYFAAVTPVLGSINAIAHITGGGIRGNLVRVLPAGCGARVDVAAWEVPSVFSVLQAAGHVERDEMFEVFNMGVGLIVVTAADRADAVRQVAEEAGVQTWMVGEVVAGTGVSLE